MTDATDATDATHADAPAPDAPDPGAEQTAPVVPEPVDGAGPVDVAALPDDAEPEPSSIVEPGRLLRIGHMLGVLREELDDAGQDLAGRERLVTIYEQSVEALAEVLTGSLRDELRTFAITFEEDEEPTAAELRVAHAQLVGWLEGLLRGLQAALASQGQQQQLAALQQQLLARGGGEGGAVSGTATPGDAAGPAVSTGQYL